jgi:formylglycine-generating enzyme required for sulfatase activity
MVTNGEYHEFVLSGGYSNRELWTAEGWAWRAYRYKEQFTKNNYLEY